MSLDRDNGAGELVKADYSDSTPDVVYVYNRLGRQTRVDQGANRTLFTLTLAGQRLVETNTLGVLAGTAVTNSYDTALRRSALTLFRTNVAAALTVSYGCDTAGRLSTVGDGAVQATYGYLANSALVEEITFRQSGTQRMKTTRQYDRLNRLTSVASAPSGANQFPVGFAYQYNDANQRMVRREADGGYWRYEYDRLGQVTSGKKFWPDQVPVARPVRYCERIHVCLRPAQSQRSSILRGIDGRLAAAVSRASIRTVPGDAGSRPL